MSRLEELIEQYCPDGVEWKALSDLGGFYSGLTGKTKDDFQGGNAKFITYVNVFNNPSLKTDVEERVRIREGEKQNTVQYGDVLFTGSSETPNECGMCSVLTHHTDENLYLNSFCFGFRFFDLTGICPSFMKYLFRSTVVRKKICKTANGVTRYNISKKEFAKIEIPVPPLPVQEEIVRILDNFTELQAELQAELQKRKQQYNYYRDNLLTNYTSQQNVKEYCLGELFEFKNGLNASKEQFGHGKPIVNYVNVYKKNSIVSSDLIGRVELDASAIERYRVKRGDVFFTRTSETREEVGFTSVLLENIEDCVFSGFVLRARPITNVILPEFCKYCFATYKIRKQIIQSSTLTTRALTNGTSLSKVKIMIPPIEEQQRIVSILDRFDTLTTDLTQGLPAEIEKRRQQYEYYRDKLLTFKRKAA